jgi:hypothetical protein
MNTQFNRRSVHRDTASTLAWAVPPDKVEAFRNGDAFTRYDDRSLWNRSAAMHRAVQNGEPIPAPTDVGARVYACVERGSNDYGERR